MAPPKQDEHQLDLSNIDDVLVHNASNECLVQVFDGASTGHLLRIMVNEGCADANTGIFGYVVI